VEIYQNWSKISRALPKIPFPERQPQKMKYQSPKRPEMPGPKLHNSRNQKRHDVGDCRVGGS